MLTNDKNTQVLINKILTNKVEINLIRITILKEDEMFSGKGIVSQNEEGQLRLKFFSDNVFTENERIKMMMDGHNASKSEGSIISEFYKMEGKDENSREYSCDQIDLKNFQDNVMDFRLLGVLNSSKEAGSSTRVILAGKYRIPSTGMVNLTTRVDEKFWFTDHEDIWTIEINKDFKILITNYDNYLDVLIHGNEEIGFADVDDIVDSLNFVLGTESEPVFINVTNKGYKVKNRRNMLKALSVFTAPLNSNRNYGNDFTINHNNLFCLYFKYIRQDSKKMLPIIHRRIVSGSRNYIYAAALILSVQIETLSKDYYSQCYKADEDFISSLNESIDLICNSKIKRKNEIAGLLKSKIPKDRRNDKSVMNILKNLVKENIISEPLIDNWAKMRSITAHGDRYCGDEVTLLLENWFLCTNLYYQLIFHLIGYEGHYSWKEYGKNHLDSYPIKV